MIQHLVYMVLVLVSYERLQVERVPVVQSELIDCFVLYLNVSGSCVTTLSVTDPVSRKVFQLRCYQQLKPRTGFDV